LKTICGIYYTKEDIEIILVVYFADARHFTNKDAALLYQGIDVESLHQIRQNNCYNMCEINIEHDHTGGWRPDI